MVDLGREELEFANIRTESMLNALYSNAGEPNQFLTSLEANFTDSNENLYRSQTNAKLSSDDCFKYPNNLTFSGSGPRDFMEVEHEGNLKNIQQVANYSISTAKIKESQEEEMNHRDREQRFVSTHQTTFITEKNRDTSRNPEFPEDEFFIDSGPKNNSADENQTSEYETKSLTEKLVIKLNSGAQEFLDTCFGLIPAMKKTTAQNYGEFLVGVVSGISDEITLEELYTLLYPQFKPFTVDRDCEFEIKHFVRNLAGSDSIKLCSFIVRAFELSHMRTNYSEPESMKTILLAPVNCEEFKRTFLAIKILYDSFKTEESTLQSKNAILRKAIYKVYCEVSRNLAANMKKPITSSKRQKSTVMGIAQFGKLTKLVFPDLVIRRLGKRGHSESYYLGLDWNSSIVGEDMILKLGLSLPIRACRSRTDHTSKQGEQRTRIHGTDLKYSSDESFERASVKTNVSPYSFVDAQSKFPGGMCQPRVWKHSTGNIPKQSAWSRIILLKSVKCLKSYKVDVWPVVLNFHRNIFSSEFQHVLSTDFIKQMNILISGESDEKGFMHLYLTILLLMFPVILASNKEVDIENKVVLRRNLGFFINKISRERFNLPKAESNYLINFLNIIRKMIHVNEMTSSQVRTGLAESIIGQVSLRLESRMSFDVCDQTVLEELIFKAVIMASNAFRPAFVHPQKGRKGNTAFLVKVMEAFMNFANSTKQMFNEFARSSKSQDKLLTYDLPYQLFRLSSKSFHQICLSDPLIKDLPINVIHYVTFQINKEIQNASFNAFGLQDHELAKEIFKTWWIHSTLFEEYFMILAEIVALSEKLKT